LNSICWFFCLEKNFPSAGIFCSTAFCQLKKVQVLEKLTLKSEIDFLLLDIDIKWKLLVGFAQGIIALILEMGFAQLLICNVATKSIFSQSQAVFLRLT